MTIIELDTCHTMQISELFEFLGRCKCGSKYSKSAQVSKNEYHIIEWVLVGRELYGYIIDQNCGMIIETSFVFDSTTCPEAYVSFKTNNLFSWKRGPAGTRSSSALTKLTIDMSAKTIILERTDGEITVATKVDIFSYSEMDKSFPIPLKHPSAPITMKMGDLVRLGKLLKKFQQTAVTWDGAVLQFSPAHDMDIKFLPPQKVSPEPFHIAEFYTLMFEPWKKTSAIPCGYLVDISFTPSMCCIFFRSEFLGIKMCHKF